MTPEPDAAPVEPDAGPEEPDACVPNAEICNEADDDCDGVADEDFDLSSDLAHCGGCDQACPALPNTEVQCLTRQCLVIGCLPGWRDENQSPEDGCEFPIVNLTFGPDDHGNAVRDTFELTIELDGVQHVDRVTVNVANERLANIEAAESIVTELDLSQRFEGETLLTVRAYDENDTVLATSTLFVIIDRTSPQLRIASPDIRSEIADEPFPVILEVTDLTGVTASIYVDDELAESFPGRPYEGTIDPTEYASGPHLIRAEATDAAGNTAVAEVEVSFIFCADAEMVPIQNLDAAIDAYEASRPDATVDTEGENESLACSRAGVLPWREVNYEDASRACQAAGKRLCTQNEWESACGGPSHWPFPYAIRGPDIGACNGRSNPRPDGLLPTGELDGCVTPSGVYDLSGNVAEWIDGRFGTGVSGGHYSSANIDLRCDAHLGLQGQAIRQQHGFRCCRDL